MITASVIKGLRGLLKTKQQYFKNLSLNDITGNKTFRRTIKPCSNQKRSGSDKITLSGNVLVITSEKEIKKTMNNYFINITKHLNLKLQTASNTMDIEEITSAFNNHVSIIGDRGVTGGGKRGSLPCPFSKIGKKSPNLGKKCFDCCHLWVKFLI